MNFWQKLKERGKVVGLSPMDGVTDAPFRYMVSKYGVPRNCGYCSYCGDRRTGKLENCIHGVNVIFTEFVSVDGLHFATGERRERLLQAFMKASEVGELTYKPYEVAQVFGSKPEYFAEAAELIESLGFDGMDINMGCPAKNVSENGCGAGLIRTPGIAQEIVRAAKAATSLPISIKTRLGVTDKSEMETWITAIMEAEPASLALHGRTLKQMYTGEADWEKIGAAAEIVHKAGGMILGNGDIKSIEDLKEKVKTYGVDGGLIGRAAEGNPGIFAGINEPTQEQKMEWMQEHTKVYEQVYGKEWFVPMRKHLAWYAHGFLGAVELRGKLVRVNSAKEVEEILRGIFVVNERKESQNEA